MTHVPDHNTALDAPETADGDGGFATILQVLPAMGAGGGVERGTIDIAEAVVAAGGRALVASAGGPGVHELKRIGAEHVELPVDSKNPLTMWQNVRRLEELIRREGVALVHARSRAPAWSACFAAKRAGVPLITTFHGTYNRSWWLKNLYNSIMTRGERVICISEFIAGHVRRYYGTPVERIRVIHRGVDVTRFDPARVSAERVIQLSTDWRIDDGRRVIMLPGRLTRWKGQTVFIEAIAKMGRKDILCLLVGSDQGRDGYRDELEQLVMRHDLGEVVRLVDHCADMPAAYMLTDVVVSASTDPEAFGRVVAEAQALGRPVIATDHGGAKETVIEGVTGWLVPPGDSDALAAALTRCLALEPAERTALSERAIDHVRQHFSKDAMAWKTLNVYREVLAAHAASPTPPDAAAATGRA